MKIKIWPISLALAAVITAASGFNASKKQHEIADKLIRIHVVANSDSEKDQKIKLAVRDAVIEKLENTLEGSEDRQRAQMLIASSLIEVENVAKEVLNNYGVNDSVNASIAVESFPQCEYETFSLPAGDYTSLRIVIGEGNGHNWWCVVYPSLCTMPLQETAAAAGFTDEEIKFITSDSGAYVVRFKILELFEKLRMSLKR